MPVPIRFPIDIKAPETKGATTKFDAKRRFDHKVKTKQQPLVKVKFNKEVAFGGKLFAEGSEADIPLDVAHALHQHLVK